MDKNDLLFDSCDNISYQNEKLSKILDENYNSNKKSINYIVMVSRFVGILSICVIVTLIGFQSQKKLNLSSRNRINRYSELLEDEKI